MKKVKTVLDWPMDKIMDRRPLQKDLRWRQVRQYNGQEYQNFPQSMYFVLNILNILKQEAQKCVDLVNNQNNHELEQPESMNAFQIWCDRLKDLRSNAPQSLFFKIEAETIDQVLEEIVELCASCDSQDQIEKAVREYILASRREFPRENIAPLDLIANRNFEGVKRIVRSRVYFILATHPSFKNNL